MDEHTRVHLKWPHGLRPQPKTQHKCPSMLLSDLLDSASRVFVLWHQWSELTATVRQQLLLSGTETSWISIHTYVCWEITTSAALQMLLLSRWHATWSAVQIFSESIRLSYAGLFCIPLHGSHAQHAPPHWQYVRSGPCSQKPHCC